MGSYRIEKNPVMPDQPDRDNTRRQKLDEVIGAFLIALDSGQNPNPAEWLARHPDLCPELAEFFADRERLDDLVEPLMVAPPQQAAAPTVSMAAVRSSSSDSSPQTAPGNTEDDRGPALAPDDDGASIALPQGTRVRYFGDYELQKVLGEGGMGVVYKARQISLNRPVALKMIKAARFASDDDLRRFQNEAEAVARLDHPNIVPIFEVGQFEDQHYFSMKLIAGDEPRQAAQGLHRRPAARGPARRRGGRRDPPCASARHPPPRPEAGEHPDRSRWSAPCHRLRPGQAGRGGQRADPVGRDPGDAGLHGSGAGVGHAGHRDDLDRRVWVGGDPLRAA